MLTLVIPIAACSESSSGPAAPELEAAALALLETPPEISEAIAIVEQECLREAGFDAPLVVRDGSAGRSTVLLNVTLTVTEAANEGYGFSSVDPSQAAFQEWLATMPRSEQDRLFEVLMPSEGERVTFEGDDGSVVSRAATGCMAEASTAIYGSPETELRLMTWTNMLSGAVRDGSTEGTSALAGEVRAATEEYTGCMTAADYGVATMQEAREVAASRFEADRIAGGPLTAEEITMATTDAGCQEESGLRAAFEQARLAAGARFLEDSQDEMLGLVEAQTEARDRARQVLANTR